MAKLGVFTATLNRPHLLSRLVRNLIGQSFRDFSLYVGIQNQRDIEAPEVQNALAALSETGIEVTSVRVPFEKGGFVATKNALLERVREPYAFHTDDDYVFEGNYLKGMVEFLEENPDVDCVSGNVVLSDEIPVDQADIRTSWTGEKIVFCRVDEEVVLHWGSKIQRVNCPRNTSPISIDALAEQFAFRMDRWETPFDLFFDRRNFFLNETEWTFREFSCAYLPAFKCCHLRDGSALSHMRERDLSWMSEATRYFCQKHFRVSLRGVRWKPKFWLEPGAAVEPGLVRLTKDEENSEENVLPPTLSQLRQLLEHLPGGQNCAPSFVDSEIFEKFLLVSCAGDARGKDVLFERRSGSWEFISYGRALRSRTIWF